MEKNKIKNSFGEKYTENYCSSWKTSGGKDVCANMCECLRFKGWQRQKMQDIILVVEGQVAMSGYLQSSLYRNYNVLRQFAIPCHSWDSAAECRTLFWGSE